MLIDASPRASCYPGIRRGDRALGSLSPRIVRAEDVYEPAGNSSESSYTRQAAINNDPRPLYDLPSPVKRQHLETATSPRAAAAATVHHGMPAQSVYGNDTRQGAFDPFSGGPRANGGGGGGSSASSSANTNSIFNRRFDVSRRYLPTPVAVPRDLENNNSNVYSGPAPPAMRAAPAAGAGAAPPAFGGGGAGAGGSPARQRKVQCVFEGCGKRPTHAQRGEKAMFCAEHRTGGMTEVVRRNRCLRPECNNPPRYALPGQKAEYCSQHKMENYVDVKVREI